MTKQFSNLLWSNCAVPSPGVVESRGALFMGHLSSLRSRTPTLWHCDLNKRTFRRHDWGVDGLSQTWKRNPFKALAPERALFDQARKIRWDPNAWPLAKALPYDFEDKDMMNAERNRGRLFSVTQKSSNQKAKWSRCQWKNLGSNREAGHTGYHWLSCHKVVCSEISKQVFVFHNKSYWFLHVFTVTSIASVVIHISTGC